MTYFRRGCAKFGNNDCIENICPDILASKILKMAYFRRGCEKFGDNDCVENIKWPIFAEGARSSVMTTA